MKNNTNNEDVDLQTHQQFQNNESSNMNVKQQLQQNNEQLQECRSAGFVNSPRDKIDQKFKDIELKPRQGIYELRKTDNSTLLSPELNTDTDIGLSPVMQNNAASQHNPQDDMQCQKLSSPDSNHVNFVNSMQNYYPSQAPNYYQQLNGQMGQMNLMGNELQAQQNITKASAASQEMYGLQPVPQTQTSFVDGSPSGEYPKGTVSSFEGHNSFSQGAAYSPYLPLNPIGSSPSTPNDQGCTGQPNAHSQSSSPSAQAAQQPQMKNSPVQSNHIDSDQVLRTVTRNNDAQLHQLAQAKCLSQGIPLTDVTLQIRVVPLDGDDSQVKKSPTKRKFQLDKKDLENAFQAYGPITKIEIVQLNLSNPTAPSGSPKDENGHSECVGLVTFADVVHAFFARLYLDNLQLVRDNAQLKVTFCSPQTNSNSSQFPCSSKFNIDHPDEAGDDNQSEFANPLQEKTNAAESPLGVSPPCIQSSSPRSNQQLNASSQSCNPVVSQFQPNSLLQNQSSVPEPPQQRQQPQQSIIQPNHRFGGAFSDTTVPLSSNTPIEQVQPHASTQQSPPASMATNMPMAQTPSQQTTVPPVLGEQSCTPNQDFQVKQLQAKPFIPTNLPSKAKPSADSGVELSDQVQTMEQHAAAGNGLLQASAMPYQDPAAQLNASLYFNHYDHYDPYQTEEEQGIKYTCRYDIQIENESVFQVARRVIGSKGANMKRIIEDCSRGFDTRVNPYEIVKLRLRGKGSGFKEGPNQVESEDPLNICISSKYKDKYDYACGEMDKLLVRVYDEFKAFYRNKARKPLNYHQELRLKKVATITRPKLYADGEEHYDDGEEEQVSNFNPSNQPTGHHQQHSVVNQQIKASINQIIDQNSQAHQFGHQPFYSEHQQMHQIPQYGGLQNNMTGFNQNGMNYNNQSYQVGINQYFGGQHNPMPQYFQPQHMINSSNMSMGQMQGHNMQSSQTHFQPTYIPNQAMIPSAFQQNQLGRDMQGRQEEHKNN